MTPMGHCYYCGKKRNDCRCYRRMSLVFLVFAWMLGCCATPAILTPPPTPDTPCGYTAHGCGNGMCCPNRYACSTPQQEAAHGGQPYCTFVGDDQAR